jgi:hypothetical protein
MLFDFTTLLAPAALVMAALVVLPVAVIATTALRAARTRSDTGRGAGASRRRGRDDARVVVPHRLAERVRTG